MPSARFGVFCFDRRSMVISSFLHILTAFRIKTLLFLLQNPVFSQNRGQNGGFSSPSACSIRPLAQNFRSPQKMANLLPFMVFNGIFNPEITSFWTVFVDFLCKIHKFVFFFWQMFRGGSSAKRGCVLPPLTQINPPFFVQTNQKHPLSIWLTATTLAAIMGEVPDLTPISVERSEWIQHPSASVARFLRYRMHKLTRSIPHYVRSIPTDRGEEPYGRKEDNNGTV